MRGFLQLVMLGLLALSTPASASPDVDFPQPGTSYGGKVRGGPGMQYQQVGSLREGDSILILNGTGAMMNGYEWFQIRFHNGRTGYQWGGIICSQKPYPTIYRVCPGYQPQAAPQPTFQNPPVTQPAQVDEVQVKANGFNVVVVNYNGGGFVRTGIHGQWTESDHFGNEKFYFQQTSHDPVSVTLFDASRNVTIKLDLSRRKILYGEGNQPLRDLYDITYADK